MALNRRGQTKWRWQERGVATLGWAVVWLALIAGVTWAMQRWLAPAPVQVTAQGDWLIPRGRDGHFHVRGTVGGQPVQFLVDTGASVVVVTEALARRASLPQGEAVTFQTAAGAMPGRMVSGVTVTVSGPQGQSRSVSRVRVGVGLVNGADSGGRAHEVESALLGQSFLRHFEVQISGDALRLRSHSAALPSR